jgi:multidrug efflux pump subunit AcrA (membrane-fusion protein)
MSVGALARGSVERPFEGRRFDILLALNSPPAELRPEMTARVEIRLAERADALRIPINAVFDGPSGEKIALLVRGTGSDTRVLKLGVQDDLHYEVLAGVEAGDRVRLNTASAPSMR